MNLMMLNEARNNMWWFAKVDLGMAFSDLFRFPSLSVSLNWITWSLNLMVETTLQSAI